jgi:hypothetical protein
VAFVFILAFPNLKYRYVEYFINFKILQNAKKSIPTGENSEEKNVKLLFSVVGVKCSGLIHEEGFLK